MKVAVLGAAGMLGAVTVREWFGHGHDVVALSRAELDVTNPGEVVDTLTALAPDVVINCTAYNQVDEAEDDPSPALAVNSWAVRTMARTATTVGTVFVHYSTDFVFNGVGDRPYTEDDAPNPQSAYGVSKLLGEWFALEAGRHYVLRVESLFGGSASRSTIDRMFDAMRSGRKVHAFIDRVVSPSHADDVARATRELIQLQAPSGVYHCVNTGRATWFEVACQVRAYAGLPAAVIVPVSTADVRLRARRPNFAALSNSKLASLGIKMPEWNVALGAHFRGGSP